MPYLPIPGIPRLRAGTDLLSISNYVAFRHFQHRRARASAGPFRIASYESRAGDEEGYCASDHERKESRAEDQKGYCASYHERTGASDHEEIGTGDRERKKSQAGDQNRCGASDHERKESRAEDQKEYCASCHERTGSSNTAQPLAHYSYKTPEGKKESAPVITQYYPKQIVYPFAKIDRHLDRKLTYAATIAQERAHAHSRSRCWHYVKEALLASGVIDSRPKSELAKEAAQDLVSNYGFKRLSVSDPFAAPIGSVLVYGANRAAGHVEIRTRDGFVSDFRSKTPSPRPLLGVYAKL